MGFFLVFVPVGLLLEVDEVSLGVGEYLGLLSPHVRVEVVVLIGVLSLSLHPLW